MSSDESRAAVVRGVAWGGAVVFAASLVYFGYFYLVELAVPGSPVEGVAMAATLDVLLFSVFALHHSVFARGAVKAVIQQYVPARFERTLFVWVASTLFLAVCLLWRPLPGTAWQCPDWARWALYALQVAGVAVTLRSAARIDIWELAGTRQLEVPRGPAAEPVLTAEGPYGWVRHPIYLGWLLLVWPVPTMTGSRLVFAAASTLYLVLAIPIEERSLLKAFGARYAAYKDRVRWRLVPGLW